MSRLFNRDLILNAGGLEIRARDPETRLATPTLRVAFQVTRSGKKDPNTADVSIYNLSKESRSALQEKNIVTTISAGYAENVSQIFIGELQRATSVRDGADWITSFQSGDGVKAYKQARISKSFAGPVAVTDVLEAAVNALGVGLGNLREKLSEGGLREALTEFTNGFVAKGKAEQTVEKIAKALGYTFSIQDGQARFLGPTDTVNTDQVILLTSTSGLIGSPEPGEDGIVKTRSLLQPDLLPGRRVKVEALEVDGFFRIEKSVFVGDTWGDDWYTDLELKPL